jgi:hypothetical protein
MRRRTIKIDRLRGKLTLARALRTWRKLKESKQMTLNRSKVLREAAKRSLLSGDGLEYLERFPRLYEEFWRQRRAMDLDDYLVEKENFCMALLMMAAMYER